MLLLDQEVVSRLLSVADCIDIMASTLAAVARGEAILPLRTVVRLPESPNAFGVMPAYLGESKTIGAKIITVFPGNHGTSLDSHQGAVLLFDPVTGSLSALLDATTITTVRTAAVSAVATRLLARADAADLTILGSGVQAHAHLEAMLAVRPIARLRVWSRNASRAAALARHASDAFGIGSEVCSSADDAVRQGSIVCTTTSAVEPVLRGEALTPGTHVNAVGACTPNARELDTTAVVRSRLYVDRRDAALREPGDLLVPLQDGDIGPEHVVAELGELLVGRGVGRREAQEITLFKSLGLAVEDLAAAHFVLQRARERGAGMSVELGGLRATGHG